MQRSKFVILAILLSFTMSGCTLTSIKESAYNALRSIDRTLINPSPSYSGRNDISYYEYESMRQEALRPER